MKLSNWLKERKLKRQLAKAEKEKANLEKKIETEAAIKKYAFEFRDSLIAAGLTPIQYYVASASNPNATTFWFVDKNHIFYRASVGPKGGVAINKVSL